MSEIETNVVVEAEKAEETTKKYELKTLDANDIFPMVNLINKFGIENFKKVLANLDFKKIVDKDGNVNMNQIGAIVGINIALDVVAIVFANLHKCEDEFFAFLARITYLEEEVARKIPLDELAQIIVDFVHKKELRGFFSVVSKLLK